MHMPLMRALNKVWGGGGGGRSFEARLVEVGSKAIVTGKDFHPDTVEMKAGTSRFGESVGRGGVAVVPQGGQGRQEMGQAAAPGALHSVHALPEVEPKAPAGSGSDHEGSAGDAKAVKVKGSQEAHEAIRPALQVVGAVPAATDTPDGNPAGGEEEEAGSGAGSASVSSGGGGGGGLEEQHRAPYDLVYRRTLASAMAESEADLTTVSLGAGGVSLGDGEEVVDVVLKASGMTTLFEGFLKISRRPHPHPARFSEASFIKELEAKGVGRPSTYANLREHHRYPSHEDVRKPAGTEPDAKPDGLRDGRPA
ncbi:conserved unknown protein [Ectocarpus siliculosus]|uniref:DNA topoisomerase type IA DNA-binding domain-containing protein n=1 Tax=Ectocarpus siliculosus TaxID=2880 RepID=D7G724_ECTSI|nr:conserved unknown protein [Ectocarpus siliculosus]|eukprot:CBJ25717.1 conserved unknown protein [Ectocarpus siliculosus]